MKLQVPSSKHQRGSKFQARIAGRGLELGTWDLFGVWSLVFGVSISVSCVIRMCLASNSRSRVHAGPWLPGKNLADDVFDGHFLNIDVGDRQFVQQRFANGDDAVAFDLQFDRRLAVFDDFAVSLQTFRRTLAAAA